MSRFWTGVIVGAALGVAGTLLATRRGADDAPSAARPPVAPTPAPASVSTPRRTRPTPDIDAPAEPPSATDRTVAKPVIHLERATLDELIALMRRRVEETDPTSPQLQLRDIRYEIGTRFPDYVYPVEFVIYLLNALQHRHDISSDIADTCVAAIGTWTTDVALAEFEKRRTSTGSDVDTFVGWIAAVLETRGVGLPTDSVKSLLREDDETLRYRGLLLSEKATDVDAPRIREIAARDGSEAMRAAALDILRVLVVERNRLRPDDVAEVVVAALADPDERVQRSAREALVAAGPRGADAAFSILSAEGDDEDGEYLVDAVVAAGRGRNLLDLRRPAITRRVAIALVENGGRPDQLRELMPRFSELRDAVAGDPPASHELFVAVCGATGPRAATEAATTKSLDARTRSAAVSALVACDKTRTEGIDVARRIVSDRTEGAALRNIVVDRLLDSGPEEGREAYDAELRAFLRELLREEKNDRVRAHVREALKE